VDAKKLARLLVRVAAGEAEVWREVRVPSVAEEAARQASRDRTDLVAARTRLTNQMGSWLALWGVRLPRARGAAWWTAVRQPDGAALPAEVQARLARAEARLAVVDEQLATIAAAQRAAARSAAPDSPLGRLVQLKGVAATSAAVLLEEGLVWRGFRNRRQVGGMLGFAPTPFASGERVQEQGISRAGNARLQAVAIQLAWSWVLWQRSSALTQWFERRFAEGGKRQRRIGIVAVARRLLIALWRYATTGVVPAGAILKA
jgi:transposase